MSDTKSYEIIDDINHGKAIRCEICGTTSHNPNDVMNRYCSKCKYFHRDDVQPTRMNLQTGQMLAIRECTAQRPMPFEEAYNFFWIHKDAEEVAPFLNLVLYKCPHCNFTFTALPSTRKD